MIKFRVNGLPAPQGSKRHVGGGRMVESSRAVGPWREAVRASAAAEVCRLARRDPEGLAGTMYQPQSVTVVFVLPRPKSHYLARESGSILTTRAPRYPAKRPDLDKLCRAVLDGLVDGGLMADDGLVVSLNCAKVWAANGEAPGAVIDVEAMT